MEVLTSNKLTVIATQPSVVVPPKVERSRDLISWLDGECEPWLQVISTLAHNAENDSDKDPALKAIGVIAFDLHCLLSDVLDCLRADSKFKRVL